MSKKVEVKLEGNPIHIDIEVKGKVETFDIWCMNCQSYGFWIGQGTNDNPHEEVLACSNCSAIVGKRRPMTSVDGVPTWNIPK